MHFYLTPPWHPSPLLTSQRGAEVDALRITRKRFFGFPGDRREACQGELASGRLFQSFSRLDCVSLGLGVEVAAKRRSLIPFF